MPAVCRHMRFSRTAEFSGCKIGQSAPRVDPGGGQPGIVGYVATIMICDGKSMAFSGHFRQSPKCPVRIPDHRPLGADIRAAGRARSILGAALLARGALFARKDTLVDRAGLSNESLPLALTLWDKRYYFAHGASRSRAFYRINCANFVPVRRCGNWNLA